MKKKAINIFLSVLFIALIGVTGCSGVSEEELAELQALRAEVKSLNTESSSLKERRAAIEKEIAEKNAQLEECAKTKSETQENLSSIGQQ